MRRRSTARRTRDRGMATVVVLALGAVVSAAAAAGVAVGAVVAARHRAGAAADFAALAAAAQPSDRPGACRAAARVAADDGGRLELCRIDGEVAEVQVSVPLAGLLAHFGPARATARAGPTAPDPGRVAGPTPPVGVGAMRSPGRRVTWARRFR
ncbi:MAG: Rv3654c family TadE-like protein [Actinomycetes bacterium]